jgi:hypothetical protein
MSFRPKCCLKVGAVRNMKRIRVCSHCTRLHEPEVGINALSLQARLKQIRILYSRSEGKTRLEVLARDEMLMLK